MKNSKSAQRYKVALAVASRNLKKLSDAGVPIAMGTDTGPPARFQGYFELMELELMVKAGLTPRQVLASATRDAARCMKLDEVGTLEAEEVGRLRRARCESARRYQQRASKISDVYVAGNKVNP